MKEVLICGSVAFDTITTFEGRFADHILPEHIRALSVSFYVPQMRREYGGCAGNIAYNLSLLGGNPIPWACVGNDAQSYLDRFKVLGISSRGIKIIPDAFTAQCHITTDLDGNQITAFHPGAMTFSAQNNLNKQNNEKVVWAIVAPDAKDGMFAHAERLNEIGIPFIFDLGQAMPLFEAKDLLQMMQLAQVLTVNDYEASVIEQRMGTSMQQLSKSMQAVIVTRGAEGTDLYLDGSQQRIPPVKVDHIIDPTGCGDAHRAGLLYGLTQGKSWLECCQLGNVMGAIKVASQGPQNHQVSKEQISKLLNDNYGTPL